MCKNDVTHFYEHDCYSNGINVYIHLDTMKGGNLTLIFSWNFILKCAFNESYQWQDEQFKWFLFSLFL